MAGGAKEAARTSLFADGVRLEPKVQFDHGTLVVSGAKGVVLERHFERGDPVFISSAGLANGNYGYEVRFATRTSAFKIFTNDNGGFGERMRIVGSDVAINRLSVAAGNVLQVGSNATNGNGAALTDAGVWTDGSSREHKDRITSLDARQAIETVRQLEPVTYVGKESPDGEQYVGFIAEDVPALVAMNQRKGLSPMDIVAVLTKVVQEQQTAIGHLTARLGALEQQRPTSR